MTQLSLHRPRVSKPPSTPRTSEGTAAAGSAPAIGPQLSPILSTRTGIQARGTSPRPTERELTRWRCPDPSSQMVPPPEVSPSSPPSAGDKVLPAPLRLLLLLPKSQKPTHLAKPAENDLTEDAKQLSMG